MKHFDIPISRTRVFLLGKGLNYTCSRTKINLVSTETENLVDLSISQRFIFEICNCLYLGKNVIFSLIKKVIDLDIFQLVI